MRLEGLSEEAAVEQKLNGWEGAAPRRSGGSAFQLGGNSKMQRLFALWEESECE